MARNHNGAKGSPLSSSIVARGGSGRWRLCANAKANGTNNFGCVLGTLGVVTISRTRFT